MNKRIKRIIAITLVLGTFSSIAPIKYFNPFIANVYASSSSSKDYGIEDLEVRKVDSTEDDDDDDTLTMYTDSGYDDTTSFEKSEYDYYLKTSGNSIKMKVSRVDGCTYKIFKSGSNTAYSSSDELGLSSGNNTFYIRTYETGDFDSKNVEKNQIRCYEIHVERKGSSSVNLKDIALNHGSINFSKSTSSYNVEVESDVDEITITAKPDDNDYTVRIDDTKVTDDDNFRKKVSLNKGKNIIKVKVGDDADNSKTYTLNIYRGTTATATKATIEYGPKDYSQPSVYLNDLKLNNGDISLTFTKNISIYNVKVDSSVDEMYVAATPEEASSKVEINEKRLTSEKEYEASLKNLITGKNTFTIEVTDADGNSRKYTLNIYRGVDISTTNTAVNTTTNQNTNTVEVKPNQWVKVSEKWQYNGSDGKAIKSQLFYDDNYKKTYALNAEGFLATGWQTLNGKSYYADNDGSIHKGWLHLDQNWYHFDLITGIMDTNWIKDGEKYYYLDSSSGIMAHDKYIDKYKLGSDGAWNNL